MKIICIADTHNKHEELTIPDGDVLLHAGDFTEAGTRRESLNFFEWFTAQPHLYKIFTGGNHDFFLENSGGKDLQNYLPANLVYLQNSGIDINGVRFWGSPITPGNGTWAFNRQRGKEIRNTWKKIPATTNILLTHTPPYGVKDQLANKHHIGCEELFKKVEQLQIPLHVFGHIHNDYGITKRKATTFVNASCLDENYRLLHPPVVIDWRQNVK